MHIGYWLGSEKERTTDVDERIMLKWIKIEWAGIYWIDLAQDRDQWVALVNTVMNHRVL
jgi:hypothetical protein